jgi:hypothetical protein
MSKVILSIAALIASLALAWTAYHGVVIQHNGILHVQHHGSIGHY